MTGLKRNLGKALNGLGMLWIALVALFHLGVLALMWRESGFSAVRDTLSPFNVGQWLFFGITIAPGLLARYFGDKMIAAPAATRIADDEPPSN